MEFIDSILNFQGTNLNGSGCCGIMILFMVSLAVIYISQQRDHGGG